VFEIQALAQGELTTVVAAREAKEKKAKEDAKAIVKTEPDAEPASSSQPPVAPVTRARDPTFAMPGSFMSGMQLDDLKPLLSSSGMPTSLAEYILDKSAAAAPSKKYNVPDPQDVNILRARVMLMRKLFETEDGADEGTEVLDKLSEQVKRLCSPSITETDIRDILRDIAGQFCDPSRSLSSFELLQSGLIDGLLEYSDVKGVVNEEDRRNILYEEFIDTARPASSPLVMLVKRLHESLGRLETFDVETAFNGVADSSRSSSTLSRTMRIKLQAEEGQDVPKNVAAITITIQAVCPISQLNDYLHQRVLNGNNYLSSGASALANMLGFGSAGFDRAGGGPRGGGLLGALSGATDGAAPSVSAGRSSARGAASSLPERGSLAAMLGLDESTVATATRPGAATGSQESAPAPQRRRSARLSAQGGEVAETGTSPETGSSAPNPTSRLLSMLDDAPTGGAEALFGGMGMDMDYDDDYSDEGDYDAEVCGSPMLFVAELTGRYSMMTWRKNWDGLRKRSSICLWHLVSLLHIVWNELTCRWL
jgi:E3 ubiquitin-protein ligase TRIP12